MMKTRIVAIGWMTIVLIAGQLAYGQDSQNLQNTDKYQCIKKTMLYQGNIAKLKLSPGDMVDAYPSPKGDGWLKIIIEGQIYAAPASDFILWRKSRIPSAEEQAMGAKIPTTIHRDICGRTTEELAVGGVKRGMDGKIIPQTADQLAAQASIERGWARAKEARAAELLKIQQGQSLRDQKQMATKTALDIAREEAKLTPFPERAG